MDTLNSLLTTLTAALMAPFRALPSWLGLVVWSAVAGVLMTWAFRYTSSQRGLQRAVDQIRANMLGMKLFKDDLGVTLHCFGGLMGGVGRRLLLSVPPMLVMVIPFVLILAQLSVWYEFRPLRPGESAVVEMRLSPSAWDRHRTVAIETPEGVVLDTRSALGTRGLPDPAQRTVTWRIHAVKAGHYALRWRLGEVECDKRIEVRDRTAGLAPVSPLRPGPSFTDRLLYPAERAFGRSSPVESIRVSYPLPQRSTPIFGLPIPWWGTFLIVSIVAALVAKPILRVQF